MKQKEIIIDPKLGIETQKMVEMYFAVKTVNGIEGFILSEKEFLNNYQGIYALNELRSANYHAVYTVDSCDICMKPFDTIINDRNHLYRYLQATYKLCVGCQVFHSGPARILGMRLDGDIAF